MQLTIRNCWSWWNWKCRNNHEAKFEEVLNLAKAQSITRHIDRIEAASVKDWRASDYMLGRVIEPARFGREQAQASPSTVNMQINIFNEQLAKLLAQPAQAQPKPVIDVEPVPALPSPDQSSPKPLPDKG